MFIFSRELFCPEKVQVKLASTIQLNKNTILILNYLVSITWEKLRRTGGGKECRHDLKLSSGRSTNDMHMNC